MVDSSRSWSEIYRRLERDANDAEAFAALEDGVRAWARPALWQRGWHVVEDVVADTCSAVIVALEKARGPKTFKGFVLGHYLNVRRRLLAESAVPTVPSDQIELPVWPDQGPPPDELGLLQHCLGQLTARERLAVTQRYLEDQPTAVIAEALQVTEVNARQIVFSGLRRLRRCVEQLWPLGRG